MTPEKIERVVELVREYGILYHKAQCAFGLRTLYADRSGVAHDKLVQIEAALTAESEVEE